MFLRLGHPAVISSHHEQSEIHRTHARHHVFHKIVVSRYIHNAEADTRQFQMGKTEINGHATRFLLRQPIRIRAGKRLNHGTFAVIYVAGGGEDGVSLGHFLFTDKALSSAGPDARDVRVIAVHFHFETRACLMEYMSGFS